MAKEIHNKRNIILGLLFLIQMFTSCGSNILENANELTISFNYFPEDGKDILSNTSREIITTIETSNNTEITVYKWIGMPIDSYNGKCELKSDTLYLYFWEEIKEANKNKDHASLILPSQLKYIIRKAKYNAIKVEQLDPIIK